MLMVGIVRSNIEDFLVVLSKLSHDLEAKSKQDDSSNVLSFLDLSDEIKILSDYYGLGEKSSLVAQASSPDKAPEEEKKEEFALKNYKIGQQNLLTSIPIQILMSSGSLLELKNTQGDRMISDEDHFYVYKESGVKGFNPGIYKLSSASSFQSSQGAAFRMSGKIVHSNTSKPFVDRLTQQLDSSMVLIDGKIYMKYKEVPKTVSKEKANSKDSKEKEEATKKEGKDKEAKDTESTKFSKLMVIDAATLEPLRVFGQE
jgi:hypothetical protein